MLKRILKTCAAIGMVGILLAYVPWVVQAANSHSTDLESGSTQYWSIADASQTSLDLNGADYTIEVWANTESMGVCDGDSNNTMVSKFDVGGGSRGYEFSLCHDGTNGKLQSQFSYNCTNVPNGAGSSAVTINNGTWYFFATVASSTGSNVGDIAFFKGDQSNDPSLVSFHALADNAFGCNSTGQFQIGEETGYASLDPFDGKIDEVRVWSKARTVAEMAADYDTQLVGNEANLVGYWKFDNDAGVDQTANNNDLTNNNTATFSTDVPFAGAAASKQRDDSDWLEFTE